MKGSKWVVKYEISIGFLSLYARRGFNTKKEAEKFANKMRANGHKNVRVMRSL